MSSSSNVIDYFATLGRAPGPFVCKSFESVFVEEDGSSKKKFLSPNRLWNDAITDITFVMKDEKVPEDENWEVLTHSIDGRALNPPYLAVKRRQYSGRLDHITQIKLVPLGQPSPQNSS